jgi:uncharacterized damage-inducible protein DinB
MIPDWRSHFVRQTDYQIWANQVLFESLARLHPDALVAHEGLFFSSIQHTVDHMLLVLRLWAGRLRGENPTADFGRLQHPDWADLKQQLQHELRRLRREIEALPDDALAGRITYSRINGERQESAVRDILTHLMTHFAHHRGQVSAIATRLGAPAPEMDFIYFVRAMERAARESQAAQLQQ